jgi:addiction module HigA family antidote
MDFRKSFTFPRLAVTISSTEKRSITAATAVRLARFFGSSEQFWLNLQAACDVSRVKAERAAELARIKPLNASGACL